MFVASIGNVFGGDTVSTKGTYALAIGSMGLRGVGSELEFSKSRHFFDDSSPGGRGKLLTLMANVTVTVPVGPTRPYGVVGLGFIRQRRETSTEGILENISDKDIGYDVGGGVIYKFASAVGVRADLRHFKVRKSNGLSFNRFLVGVVLGGA
jgi:opacity protein-like surface antigen